MNDLYCGLDEVKQELSFLEENFIISYRYRNDKIFDISLAYGQNKRIKSLGYKVKAIISLLDWLNEPKQLEIINYIKKGI